MTTPLPPTTPLSVTLEVQWNALLAMLSDHPYRAAAPLIDAITHQANAAAAALQQPEAPTAAASAPNGEDRHVSD